MADLMPAFTPAWTPRSGGAAYTSAMIRVANTADSALLSALSAQTFREAYSSTDDPAEIERYVEEHFTRSKMLQLLSDPHSTVLLVEDGDEVIGYAHVRMQSEVPAFIEVNRVRAPVLELSRLYFTRAATGKGHGKALMRAVYEEARRRACDAIWLGVYSINDRAIRFYEREGFERAGAYQFTLGRMTYTDPVYVRRV